MTCSKASSTASAVKLMDGPLCIGIGRTVDDAVRIACNINRRLGSAPWDVDEMKAMIDTGSIKVRTI